MHYFIKYFIILIGVKAPLQTDPKEGYMNDILPRNFDPRDYMDRPEELGKDHCAFCRVPNGLPPIGTIIGLIPKYNESAWPDTTPVILAQGIRASVGYAEIDWAHGFVGIHPDDRSFHYGYAVLKLDESGGVDLMPVEVPELEIEPTFNLSPEKRARLEANVKNRLAGKRRNSRLRHGRHR